MESSLNAPSSGVGSFNSLRTLRQSLGLTLAEVARRLNVTPPAVRSFESAESEGRITLGSLCRVAAAMDFELVYTLVPRRSDLPPLQPTGTSAEVGGEKIIDLTWHAQRDES